MQGPLDYSNSRSPCKEPHKTPAGLGLMPFVGHLEPKSQPVSPKLEDFLIEIPTENQKIHINHITLKQDAVSMRSCFYIKDSEAFCFFTSRHFSGFAKQRPIFGRLATGLVNSAASEKFWA